MSYHNAIGRRNLLLGAAAVGLGAAHMGDASAASANATETPVPLTRSVGAFDVMALYDASGSFFRTREDAFPDATSADWERASRLDPEAFGPDGVWNLQFRCFAVRRPTGRIMLVDTGVGPEGSPASTWAPVPGRLPEELRAAGIDARDVDMVVLTHLHGDHVGWSVAPGGRPMFENARYVIQHDEIAALEAGGGEAMLRYVVEPLRRAGQLHEVRGRAALVGRSTTGGARGAAGRGGNSVTVVPTPGHTPGHQSVLVEGGRGQIVITGDVLVHAVQLVDPDVGYLYEADQEHARRTRQALLAKAKADRALLATCHLTEPFIAADQRFTETAPLPHNDRG